MRLCGLNVPYENQCAIPVTSERIHNLAVIAQEQGLLAYDNQDIAAALHSTRESAEGILKAVNQKIFVDINSHTIDLVTVKQELNILSEDLQKITEVVEKTLELKEGKERWPNLVPNVHGRFFSIPAEVEKLLSMSQTFKTQAISI